MSRGISSGDRGAWEARGGRVRLNARGRPTYYIRQQIRGRRFEVSTGKHSLAAALREFEKFEMNPEGYATARAAPSLYLDNDVAKAFPRWSMDERGNSREWVGKQRRAIAWWMPKLIGIDLRHVSLGDHVLPPLERVAGRRQKMAVLKALYSWLRTERHVLKAHEDPTLDLALPQAAPAQLTKSKVVPREHVDLVIEHLVSPWREALTVEAGTGWHVTEVMRFAAAGTIEPLPQSVTQDGVAGVLVCPLHKSGEPIRARVSQPVLDAAKRLRDHGPISRKWYGRAIHSACRAVKRPDGEAGIPTFTPGRLRHSVATWAIEAGADIAAVALYLGHRSPRTTKRFYATHASPPKVPTLV